MKVIVRTTGLDRIIQGFKRLNKNADLKEHWRKAGSVVATAARPLTPVLTGRLQRTIRFSSGANRAVVRAGNNRMPPYAPIQHYGGYNNIQGKYFLTTALRRNERRIVKIIRDGIDTEIDRAGL